MRSVRNSSARASRTSAEREPDLIDAVEQRLFVFLQVTVVGERQRLECQQQAGQVADDADPSCRVRAPRCRDSVSAAASSCPSSARRTAATKPNSLRSTHSTISSPIRREVHSDHRQVEQQLGDEVAVAHGIERIGRRPRRSPDRRRSPADRVAGWSRECPGSELVTRRVGDAHQPVGRGRD